MTIPTSEYRLMIYFAHSTIILYDKDLKSTADMSIQEFRDKNPELCQRVFDEAINIFNYELSWHQMDKAIRVYLNSKHKPLSVHETVAYKLSPEA